MSDEPLLPIETPRLVLRDFAPGDFEAVHRYASDPEVTRYMRWGPNDEEATRQFLDQCSIEQLRIPRPAFALAITRRDDDELIGGCGLHECGQAEAREVGYCLRRDQWGQGFASEVVTALVHFAFDGLGLERLVATVDYDNPTSERVLSRAGFVHSGRARDAPRECHNAGLWVLSAEAVLNCEKGTPKTVG